MTMSVPVMGLLGVFPSQVYCDLDGVLADFNKGCLELFPEGGIIAEKIPTHLVTKLTWEEETEMWRRVEETSGDLPAVNGAPC